MKNPLNFVLLRTNLFSLVFAVKIKITDVIDSFIISEAIKNNYKKNYLLVLFILFIVNGFAQNQTYYISSSGDDSNSGLSVGSAWKTVSKVSSFNFEPGDRILFEGGKRFTGNLEFQFEDGPFIIESYGRGKAIINAQAGNGIYAYDVGSIEIHNLILEGNGAGNNNGSGVLFYMTQRNNLSNIVIDSTEAYGFGEAGIVLGAWQTSGGYDNVKIMHSLAHDNGRAGITTYGYADMYNHSNFYVAYNKTYNNAGRTDVTDTNTGSGIIISGVDGFKVEYCEAYENGANNRNIGGGPVGIWCYNAKNGIIQYCESHHNKAGLQADGGGFDIDGGSQNCILQYNYSHDNEGPGYLLCEYGSSNQFYENTVRYNISENDGLKNGYGALTISADNSERKISECQIYNNVFYTVNPAAGAAIRLNNKNFSNVKVFNNIFYCDGVPMLKGDPDAIRWQNNNYYSTGTANFTKGGSTIDPQFISPGRGIEGYKLSPASPMIDAGLLHSAQKDIYGAMVPRGIAPDIGAFESFKTHIASVIASDDDGNVAENTIDGKLDTRWAARGDNQWIRYNLDTTTIIKTVKIAWYRGNMRKASFDIQTSITDEDWTTVFSGNSSGDTTAMESYNIKPQKANYIRIVGHSNTLNEWNAITEVEMLKDSDTSYNETSKVAAYRGTFTENNNDLKIWPNPASRLFSLKTSSAWSGAELMISDITGKVVLYKKLNQSSVQLNLSTQPKGMYMIKVAKDGKVLNGKIILQ